MEAAMIPCACGCGEMIVNGPTSKWDTKNHCYIPRRYQKGHHARGLRHSQEAKDKVSRARRGKKLSMEHRKKLCEIRSGGRMMRHGYPHIWCPEHPHANNRGYVPENRLAMEKAIGRFLDPEEIVHHINEDIADNRLENLILFPDRSAHLKHHWELLKRRGHAGRLYRT